MFLQRDTRKAGTSSDGVIARQQIAVVLVCSLTSEAANRKTFELVAVKGPAPLSLDPLFAALEPNLRGAIDGIRDTENQPLEQEPVKVPQELDAISDIRTEASRLVQRHINTS